MGNNASAGLSLGSTAASRSVSGADLFLSELASGPLGLQYEKSMGTSRSLKAIKGRHAHGAVVVKVYVKLDPGTNLKAIHRRLKAEREALLDCPNVLPYQRILETERAGYLVRQWVASNLYDRISTRPFLSLVEKRWIAFQLLTALKHARDRDVSHGDIKTENVLITSWNSLYLTDFSTSFKPTYLPLDDPSVFSISFDTSSRRTCYLAPERFYTAGSDIAKKKEKLEWGKRDGRVTEAMDVFAAGCVIAELWMEGTPMFTLSSLFKYRVGEYVPEGYLAEIEDPEIRNLIRSMISLDPAQRLTFDQYLTTQRGLAFPDIFYSFLHPFITSLNESPPSPSPPSLSAPTTGSTGEPMRTDADGRIERVWGEWESIKGYLDEEERERDKDGKGEDRRPEAAESSKMGKERSQSIFPMRLNIPGLEAQIVQGGTKQDGPALVLLSLICANLRNCLRPASILRALDVFLALNPYLTDETVLDRMVPYLVSILEDDSALVRSTALKVLTQVVRCPPFLYSVLILSADRIGTQKLLLVKTITASNSTLFTEYIFPNTKPFTTDPEIIARVTYAQCISPLADTAARFLQLTEAMKTEGRFKLAQRDFDAPYEASYDLSLHELQSHLQEHVNPLLSDPSSVVKRALLGHAGPLCAFFGRPKANDAVLAHLVTYLNTRDWQLRAAWNENAVDVATCLGARSLEEYILPLIMLSLADSEEFVVAQVLASLTILAEKRLLAKKKIWELVAQINGFLCHPNIWIREGAASFLASVSKLLQPTDRWCILYPTIKRLLRADVKTITELSLLDNAREPIPRSIFEAAVAWAGRSGKSSFWNPSRPVAKGAPREASRITDEDLAQLEKLRQAGMRPEDEFKLSVMKEYISKLATARQSQPSRLYDTDSQSGSTVLQDLGIVPQTIIFSIRTAEEITRRDQQQQQRSMSEGQIPKRFSFSEGIHSAPSVENGGRASSTRHVSSQPLEDLRRRLAMVGASNTSGGEETPKGGGDLASLPRTTSQSSMDDLSDTATSTRFALTQVQPRSRVHGNGVVVGRAAPAVGQDSTNVMGLFNVEAHYRRDDDASTQVASAVGFGRKMPPPPSKDSQRFVSTYEGNDPIIKQLLERVYLDSYREPLAELGPPVASGVPRRKALRANLSPRERISEGPDGTLIAHLVEHTAAITSIQVSPDHIFFVTGSEDGTVKVWDTMRLEKNVTSRSRQTFVQGGKITSVCVLEHSHCVASASDNGTLWIHRVDVNISGAMPKYGKAALIRQQDFEGKGGFVTCMASFNTDTTTNLILGTSLSTIIILDIRTMRNLHVLSNPLHFGPITTLCVDRKNIWLVVGTSTGVLSLWDLRFGLLLRTWSVNRTGVSELRRIHQIAIHPGKDKGRWIIVAVEDEMGTVEEDALNAKKQPGFLVVEVWDIDKGVKVEEFRAVGPGMSVPSSRSLFPGTVAIGGEITVMQEAILDPAQAIEALFLTSSTNGRPSSNGTRPSRLPNTPATVPSRNPTVSPSTVEAARFPRPAVHTFLVGTDYSSPSQDPQRVRYPNSLSNSGGGDLVTGSATGAGEAERNQYSTSRQLGYLITGGGDRKIRYWDLDHAERSSVVSGLEADDERPVFTHHTSTTRPTLYLESSPNSAPSTTSTSRANSTTAASSTRNALTKIHRSTLIAGSQQQLLRGHQDAITAMAVIELPFRCVVVGGRDGVVKVFE